MRPVNRGLAPQVFTQYEAAKPFLVERLGIYCSYCERRIPTNLAVEHIQPKGLPEFAHLKYEWSNFLLACVNCNSAKGNKDVQLGDYYLPDRDNTAVPFYYEEDGRVVPSAGLEARQSATAQATIDLVGLNKGAENDRDLMAALERHGQRKAAQDTVGVAVEGLMNNNTVGMRELIAIMAMESGFFSIWMQAFEDNSEMRQQLIKKFPGTAEECFDSVTMEPKSPRHPVPPGLSHGGKI